MSQVEVLAPFSGRVLPLEEVPDPVFSERMLGDGLALDPVEGVGVAPVLHAFQRLGVPPSQGVYVGDAPFDVEAGRRAGCLTVLTTWACPEQSRRDSANHDRLTEVEPDFVAASPDELAALLLD